MVYLPRMQLPTWVLENASRTATGCRVATSGSVGRSTLLHTWLLHMRGRSNASGTHKDAAYRYCTQACKTLPTTYLLDTWTYLVKVFMPSTKDSLWRPEHHSRCARCHSCCPKHIKSQVTAISKQNRLYRSINRECCNAQVPQAVLNRCLARNGATILITNRLRPQVHRSESTAPPACQSS
jgi:hypothetical protein